MQLCMYVHMFVLWYCLVLPCLLCLVCYGQAQLLDRATSSANLDEKKGRPREVMPIGA